ncbi:hypothetical protein FOZ62_010864 [Perkinsus olseni]|uniref:Uncharacterized protein n=1 Tax=Perkinsus olseni TaxID=32597 RepID=A0A7J6R923_PEROL|nr:hypothetical protein FOZ62_010864 [Perkinsus olseni]
MLRVAARAAIRLGGAHGRELPEYVVLPHNQQRYGRSKSYDYFTCLWHFPKMVFTEKWCYTNIMWFLFWTGFWFIPNYIWWERRYAYQKAGFHWEHTNRKLQARKEALGMDKVPATGMDWPSGIMPGSK